MRKKASGYFFHQLSIKLFGAERRGFKPFHYLFENKTGIEIGGPSSIFNEHSFLPVYKYADRVDGCNFAAHTVWEGSIAEGNTYRYSAEKNAGRQFICEGNDLKDVQDKTYDFVLSSHNLEHFANPLKAVREWLRILKPGGTLLLILPHPQYTFDHRRSVTGFDHLLKDLQENIGEDDLTHLPEILELHDYSLTPEITDRAFFEARSLKNIENRCLHQHVFSYDLLATIFDHFNIQPLYKDFARPFHMILMGQKNNDNIDLKNTR